MDADGRVPPVTPRAPLADDRAACVVSVKDLKQNWQQWSDDHQDYQKKNHFSHADKPGAALPRRGQDGYGKPPEGSMTERRGRDARTHVGREVQELCRAIRDIGQSSIGEDGERATTVRFGRLFDHYVSISDKVVGILLRARKQGLVQFEGEMLWQGRDNGVVITLLAQ